MNFTRKFGFAITAFAAIGLASAGSVAQAFTITITEGPGDTPVNYVLPNAVGPGDLVLLETGADQSRSNWSDVLRFNRDGQGGLSNTATMFSDQDWSTWNLDPSNAFITENPNGDTVFFANPNTYNIFSDESRVPEPSQALSLAMGMFGLGGLALLARKRRQNAA